MKILFALLLTLSPFTFASPISEEAFDSSFADIKEIIEVTNHNNTLFIHTKYKTIPLKLGKYFLSLTCESAALFEEWQNIQFEKIKLLNASNNQGLEWNVSPKICLRMIDKNLSDAEIDRIYFAEPYFYKF
ncbi:TPA: hypothetical protein PW393_001600 [Mannheimia haemolytica]|nr:hypothetical protein [Mannheimia haemolytica]